MGGWRWSCNGLGDKQQIKRKFARKSRTQVPRCCEFRRQRIDEAKENGNDDCITDCIEPKFEIFGCDGEGPNSGFEEQERDILFKESGANWSGGWDGGWERGWSWDWHVTFGVVADSISE